MFIKRENCQDYTFDCCDEFFDESKKKESKLMQKNLTKLMARMPNLENDDDDDDDDYDDDDDEDDDDDDFEDSFERNAAMLL